MGARASPRRRLAIGLARASGGALFFSLPLLMTMEMWFLGLHMDRLRLWLFLVVSVPLVVVLDRFSGFSPTSTWLDDVVDGFVAYAVGFATSAVILVVFGIVTAGDTFTQVVAKVALQAVPASIGAVLAASQLGGRGPDEERRKESGTYAVELFFMAAGAVFFAFNVAPTDEMEVIALKMTPLLGLVLVLLSLVTMHAFVYAVDFRGSHRIPEGTRPIALFARYTVVGYAVALLVSAYVLWTFGRYDGSSVQRCVMDAVVLAFPASLGAAAARLIL